LAAQASAAEKAKREAEERERQRQVAQAAALEKSKREAAERERQRQIVEKQGQRSQAEVPPSEKSLPAPKAKSNRKWLYAAGGVIAVVAIVIVLASIRPAPPAPTPAPKLKVGLVTDVGSVNDKSFNQSAWEGVQQAVKELGIEAKYIETADSKDYAKNIAQFADEGYDVIVTVGFGFGDATIAAAKQYPKVKFIGIDQSQLTVTPGLTGLVFPEDQSGFLAGALAAFMSKRGHIGAVLGPDSVPPVWRFGEGYRAGARYVKPDIKVDLAYHNDVRWDIAFIDPDWGKSIALSLIDNGADVIFGAGGKTGNGALLGGVEKNIPVIGVDTDQYYTMPEAQQVLLTSAMKLISPGVFNIIKDYAGGKWTDGNVKGLSGLAPYHDWDSKIPADVKAKIEELAQRLTSGKLQTGVPSAKP
jgi:basic membrane protein A and related proteins